MSEYIDTTTKVPEDATEFDYELFERFMSGGPWVAHSEYMKLKDDNAKLREQSERLFDKTLELATENSKLRELCKLCERETENAKLRELVRDLYEMAYPECPSAFEAAFANRMRELRVEVDA